MESSNLADSQIPSQQAQQQQPSQQQSQPSPQQSQPGQTQPTQLPSQQILPPPTQLTPNSQPTPMSQPQTSTQSTISIATTPTVVPQLVQGPRAVPATPIRPNASDSYLLLMPQNPRMPGIQAIRYINQTMNFQPNILQTANPTLLSRINATQLIRAQTSSSGVLQTPTSQVQTTTMASLQGRPIQIPYSTAGPRTGTPIHLANGQMISQLPIQRHQMMTSRANILQQPNLLRGVTQQGMGVPVIPTSQPMGLGVQTSIATSPMIHQTNLMNTTPPATATAPSQMTADDALAKGTSFFNSLLTKMTIKAKRITMQNLIQAVIDGKKSSEEFALALQKELNSGGQSQLVPFLELALPHLRQSLNSGNTKLPGIRPPAMAEGSQPDESSPSTSSPNKVQSNNTTPAKKKRATPIPGQKTAYAIRMEKKKERESQAAQKIKVEKTDDKKEVEKIEKPTKPKADKPKRQDKQKKQEKQLESLSSALRDDDDVNDVAAMGGVNLAEESQRIMASGAELVGTQIRSCKDEPFLNMEALSSRIARIAKEYNLSEPSKDVVTIVSHATQERLKNLVERLGILAEHRSENLKLNPKYEPSNDIKGQIKFLAELDRIEKRRYEEQEREILLRVAKSRSKVEDPEQQKLRQKAKDMQRAEQEEVRQREANETALLAIGPRKKLKTSTTSSINSFSQSSSLKDVKTSVDIRGDTMRRVKRVNMKDLQVLLELDRTHLDRLIKITAQ